jgi:hypothetical protein
MVKPEVVTLSTVPEAPPAAGPDRALEARPAVDVDEDPAVVGAEAVAEGDDAQPATSATTAHIDAAAINARLRFDGRRRGLGVRLVSRELVGS